MTLETLDDLFDHELRNMYYVENQLVDVLGELARDATNEKIRQGFEEHQGETREHVSRLEQVFEARGIEPEQGSAAALDGLIEDKRSFDGMVQNDELRNLYYAGVGIKNERMEISGYEGMIVLARKLDLGGDVTGMLRDNKDDEEATLRRLESVAKGSEVRSMLDRLM